MVEITKRGGADWDVYYFDLADPGEVEVLALFGVSIEDAVKEAADNLNTGYEGEGADWFEIVAVVRKGVSLPR